MDFVLLEQSSEVGQAPQYGGPISADQLAQIAAACELQLNRDVSLYWPGAGRVRAGSNAGDIQGGEIAAALLDNLSDSGAIAFHDVLGNDVAFIQLGRNMCSSIMADGGSVSAALSHELIETWGDKGCNLWADDGNAFSWARELCDAVESNWYAIGGVALSDFLLPPFFETGATGPYSFMGTFTFASLVSSNLVTKGNYSAVPGPFVTVPGGYQVQRNVGTGETSVWGFMRPCRAARARHPSSRPYRHGARLT